jgi:[glutamine synthetase] adenylyltransferase / [glutamine synthetase]-adenylyl-L-tyrosine phosphorylase
VGRRLGFLTNADETALQSAYRFLWRLQAGGRLLTDKPLDMEAIGEGGRAFLLRETGASELDSLQSQLMGHVATVEQIVRTCLGPVADQA